MLAGDEQDVAKPFRREVPRFFDHFRRPSSVTRRIALSREKPQYWQLLMHSLER